MTPEGPTWEYLHLVAVPFTVVLAVAGTLVGLAGWAAGRDGLERWGVLSLALAGVMAVPSYLTGLTAADVAATRTFVQPSLVQTHRSWATWTAVLAVAQGIFAVFSLLQPDDERLRRFVLSLGLGVAALAGWTAFLGGKIVHGPQADRERIEESVMRGSGEAGPGPGQSGARGPATDARVPAAGPAPTGARVAATGARAPAAAAPAETAGGRVAPDAVPARHRPPHTTPRIHRKETRA